ncbi:Radical SAM domain protein [Minicystis rosea]|nr:Radical SAM domain protein [Minicystis rosea]
MMFSQQWPHVEALLRAIRARLPTVPIFLGGEHPTATWSYLLAHCPEVTVCVLGEGEESAAELAACIAAKRPLEGIPGVAYRQGGVPVRPPPRARIRAMAAIPRPAWHLFPLESYLEGGFAHGVGQGRSIPMLATRGCPYRCTFCSSPAMWTTRYETRPPAEVVDEIEDYIAAYRIDNVDFEDLTAIVKRGWILDFCAELERRKIRITYQLPSGTRSEALDEEVLSALHRTGCRNITYAPESGSPRTLAAIKKKVVPERVLASMRAAKAVGMNLKCNLIIGFPDETRRDVWQTLLFGLRAAWAGVDDLPLFPFSPYPGTELYEDLRRKGAIPEPSNEYFAGLGYMDISATATVCEHIGPRELNLYRVVGMSAFYAAGYVRRPWRLLRTARNLVAERSDTVLEQRLVEMLQRRRAARPTPAPPPVVAAKEPVAHPKRRRSLPVLESVS